MSAGSVITAFDPSFSPALAISCAMASVIEGALARLAAVRDGGKRQ
jgi:hypothetical protein